MEIKTHVLTSPQPGLREDPVRQKDARENIDAAKKPSNTSTANLAGFDENDEIVDTGIAKANLVHDGNYVHTDNNYTDEEKNAVEANTAARHTHSNKSILDATTASFTTEDETKLDNIEAGAQVNVIETVRVDGTALDISNKSVNIDLSGKADKVSHGVEGNFAALGSDGNLVDSGIKPNSDPSSNEFSTDVPTGGAVLSIVNGLDADIVSNDDTNVRVHIVETDGKITGVSIDRDNTASRDHVHGNISTDGKIGQTSGLAVVTGSNGILETADLTTNSPDASGTALEFITSISQASTGKITPAKAAIPSATTEAPGVVQLTTNLDPNTAPTDKPATAHAVSNAISSINNVLASMHEDDHLADGKYITSLSQTNGDVSYEVANMDSSPSAGSKKPVTSGGVKTAIDNKVAGLHGTATGEGDWVNVTVTTEGGEVTSVSVDDGDIEEAIQQAIDELDVGNTLSPGTYITSLSEADGKIQVSTENMDTVPTTGSQKPVTSGGVKFAIESAVESLDYTDTPVAHQFVTGVNETDGVISVNRAQPVISDVFGLESALDSKADKITGTFDAGNLVTVDQNGNIVASDISPEDVKMRQTAVTETIPDSVTIFSSIRQDENGEITVSTSPIREAGEVSGTYHSGLMTASDKEKLDGLETSLDEKADKVDGAVVGDLASLDSQGNLADSGINLMDVITGVVLEKDDNGLKSIESLVSGHVATIQETTDAEVSRILAALH